MRNFISSTSCHMATFITLKQAPENTTEVGEKNLVIPSVWKTLAYNQIQKSLAHLFASTFFYRHRPFPTPLVISPSHSNWSKKLVRNERKKIQLLKTCLNNFHANLKPLRSELRAEQTNPEVGKESFWLSGLQGLYFIIWPSFHLFLLFYFTFFWGRTSLLSAH